MAITKTASHGNSGVSIAPSDLQDPGLYRLNSILATLNTRSGTNTTSIKNITEQITTISGGGSSATTITSLSGTHAQRLAGSPVSSLNPGSLFYETDRTSLYQVQVVGTANQWVWIGGQMLAALAGIPTDLGTTDEGFLYFENAKYYHQAQWTGSVWQRGPNDRDRAGSFVDLVAAPTEGGWHSCDGSTQNYFNYTNPAAPGSATLPNLSTAAVAYDTQSTYTPGLTSPVLPTVTTTVPPAAAASAGSGSVNNGTGSSQAVLTPPFDGGGGGGGVNIAGTVTLPGPPIENYAVIRYFRL